MVCSDRSAAYWLDESNHFRSQEGKNLIFHGSADNIRVVPSIFQPSYLGGIEVARPRQGWSNVILPGKNHNYSK